MADGDGERYVFPLTSLQIGDLQSYLSHLSLFLASESGKFYILVDNRPWLEDLMLSSTHWWQLMVTKTDTSFAVEAKTMRRWEFDSTTQAARTISSWFPGSLNERILLKEHLDETIATSFLYPIFWILRLITFFCTFVYRSSEVYGYRQGPSFSSQKVLSQLFSVLSEVYLTVSWFSSLPAIDRLRGGLII
ncbi:UNVERIFIED_CONTAM: hypothetical protein Sangu_1006100 [Sesamum angustifolium]|uniref:Uncharacterized protein n=1 Tax=Sesamum angustifolium TaxID=2727405 RepID=A0AAW2PGY7_9LAMI